MSGRGRDPRGVWSDGGRGEAAARRAPVRALQPLIDRLMDDHPDAQQDRPVGSVEALAILRASVRRDLEALLNTRRRHRSPPAELDELDTSSVGYGIPDFTAGTMNDPKRRDALRAEIEATIRRFEPRLATVKVTISGRNDGMDPTMRLRIDGLLHAEPAPEPIAFDTTIDVATSEVDVTSRDDV